jgi:hypothetical protein
MMVDGSMGLHSTDNIDALAGRLRLFPSNSTKCDWVILALAGPHTRLKSEVR